MKDGKDLYFPKGWRAKGLEIRRISEDLGSPLPGNRFFFGYIKWMDLWEKEK